MVFELILTTNDQRNDIVKPCTSASAKREESDSNVTDRNSF